MLLDKIKYPSDLKKLDVNQLPQFSDELRQEVINNVSQTGGHLGAGLGVVELTVAIHYVFNTPEDRLIWDVGHQAYPHKILTGRKDDMQTIRKKGGLSGFTKRSESEYDPFGAGHSSTSISAGHGMAIARDKLNKKNEVIAVIGDGAMSAGMAYEALNNAGAYDSKLIVILNDNDMSIAPAVGAMSRYLANLVSSKPYYSLRDITKRVLNKFPDYFSRAAKRTESFWKSLMPFSRNRTNFFEGMGFHYIGVLDGHNTDHLVKVLSNVRDNIDNKPVLIHIVTEKGRGFNSPDFSSEKYHATSGFDVETKVQRKSKGGTPSNTAIFSKTLTELAEKDDKIIAITAAMPSGTGLDKFQESYPDKYFDVGIAEQHAVTFAAGLATEGLKPFVTIYSTFLQRAYDQLIHDCAIQNLPVRFAMDRAGLVGADGATHAGSFDIAYLSCLPNMVIACPSNAVELEEIVKFSAEYNESPIAIRYPRGNAIITDTEVPNIELGKGYVAHKEGEENVIISIGTMLSEVLEAAERLKWKGVRCTVIDARFAKPIDEELILESISKAKNIVTIEEGSSGGFGSSVLKLLTDSDALLDKRFRSLILPDKYQDHATQAEQLQEAGLDADSIAETLLSLQ